MNGSLKSAVRRIEFPIGVDIWNEDAGRRESVHASAAKPNQGILLRDKNTTMRKSNEKPGKHVWAVVSVEKLHNGPSKRMQYLLEDRCQQIASSVEATCAQAYSRVTHLRVCDTEPSVTAKYIRRIRSFVRATLSPKAISVAERQKVHPNT